MTLFVEDFRLQGGRRGIKQVGKAPGIREGAADVFRLLDQTPFAQDRGRTLADTISVVAGLLPSMAEGG